MEGEETRQEMLHSLVLQEDMHFSHSTLTKLYPPKTVGTPTSLSDEDSDDDMDQGSGFASANPFSALPSIDPHLASPILD